MMVTPVTARPPLPIPRPSAAIVQSTPAKPLAPAQRPAVPLGALAGSGEARFLGPNGAPRLVPVAPFNPQGAPIVFIHGILGSPADEQAMVAAAQQKGMQVYVMAYNTTRLGADQNAAGFAAEFRALAASGLRNLTIVGHSLGGMTTKAALDRLTNAQGRLQGFDQITFIALASPWGGVSAADLALGVAPQAAELRFARDLAPASPFWQGVASKPFSPQVSFYSAVGSLDQVAALAGGDAQMARENRQVLSQARRSIVLSNDAHNTILDDPRALDFVFNPTGAVPAQPKPSVLGSLWNELRDITGFRQATP